MQCLNNPHPPHRKKLLDVVRDMLRTKHYSYRTEQTCLDWITHYTLLHQKRHLNNMVAEEIRAFIACLAIKRKVAASTQSQALSAILFLYRIVLQKAIRQATKLAKIDKPLSPHTFRHSFATHLL